MDKDKFEEKIKNLGFNDKEKFEKEQVNDLINTINSLRVSISNG